MQSNSSRSWLSACCALLILAAPACGRDRDADRTGAAGGDVAATTNLRVTEVDLGRAVGSDNRVTEETDNFRPNDTIYASVITEGGGTNATLTARWTFEDDQVVDETTQNLTSTGRQVTQFNVSRPGGWPEGRYTLRILLNGREVETESFRVSN